jgi:hypothetical protein
MGDTAMSASLKESAAVADIWIEKLDLLLSLQTVTGMGFEARNSRGNNAVRLKCLAIRVH